MTFGALLKDWRSKRRSSQLDLALDSGVSARHISFLETGRAKPSREMVLRLAGELDVPIDARNDLLVSAGLAPAYRRRDFGERQMAMARQAVGWMIDRHDPYPGFALDRHWNIVRANDSAMRLLDGFDIGEGDSLLDAFLTNEALREAIVNRDEVIDHTIARLVAESRHYGGDGVLDHAIDQLQALAHQTSDGDIADAFLPVHYRIAGQTLAFFSTFTHFLTAQDIALAELRVELMFPADESTKQTLLELSSSG